MSVTSLFSLPGIRLETQENRTSRVGWRRLGREAVVVCAGQLLVAWGGLVGVKLLSGALGPVAYGELALWLTLTNFVQQSFSSPLSQASFRYFAFAAETNCLRTYIRQVQRVYGRLVVAVALGASIGVLVALSRAKPAVAWGVAGVGILSVLAGYNTILDGFQNAARNRVVVAVHQALLQWSRPLAAILCIALVGGTALAALGGLLAGSAIVLASQRRFFQGAVRSAAGGEGAADFTPGILRYALPLVPWGILAWVQNGSDRWLLATFQSASSVGLYNVVYQLGYYPMLLASSAAAQIVLPVLFGKAGDGLDRERLGRTLRLNRKLVAGHLTMGILASLLALGVAGPFGRWLLAPAYHEAIRYLPAMVLAGGLTATGHTACQAFLAAGKPQGVMAMRVAIPILTVAFNVLGAWRFGIAGVVGANLLASAIYCGWAGWRAGKLTRQFSTPVGALWS